MKKHIALVLAVLMILNLFAGCGGETPNVEETTQPSVDTTGEVKITDGVYWIGGDGWELPYSFIHFYEDGTYYAKYFGGSMVDAGVWELVDEPTAYYVDANENFFADDPDERESTVDSEQTIILTPYSTGVAQRIAYVNDMLCNMSLGSVANNRYLQHDAAYAYNPDVDEVAIQLFVFYANNDIASNFILNHNRTFEDVTGEVFDTGVWEMTGAGEYTLTYDFGGSAVLTVNEDGTSAVLTKDDGTVVELRDSFVEEAGGVALQMSLRAENVTVPELPMSVNVRLDGYSDGTCQMIIEVAAVGAELIADAGTFEVSAAMQPTFHFEKAGDITGTPDYAGASSDGIPFTVSYSAAVEPEFNGAATPMTLEAEVAGIYNPNAVAEATVVATMRADDVQVGLPMGVGVRIDCYSDNTAKLIVEVAAVGAEMEADSGTYEVSAAMRYTFHFENAGEVIGEPDYASATDNSIEINVPYTANVEVEFNGSVTPLTIGAILHGVHCEEPDDASGAGEHAETAETTEVVESSYRPEGVKYEALEVPAEYTAECAQQGTKETISYTVTSDTDPTLTTNKTAFVYLPYGYDANKQYDILYLLHGGGGNEAEWFVHGDVIEIINNSISRGEAKEMIIVTPTFYYPDGFCGAADENKDFDYEQFANEIRTALIPAVESKYSTYAGGNVDEENLIATRDHRAFAGLSMGSMHTLNSVLMRSLDLFAWYGSFSGAQTEAADISQAIHSENFAEYPINYLFVVNGTADFSYEEHIKMMLELEETDDKLTDGENFSIVILEKADHDWPTWTMALYRFLPIIFK